MRLRFVLIAALVMLATPAAAQLEGTDLSPGDACSLTGATAMTADADGDGGSVTLICNGTTWEPEAPLISGSCSDGDSVVFDSASGGFRCEAASSMALTDLSDVVITSPDDGVALVYESSTGNWVNKTCDDSPNTAFAALENQALSTLVTSQIRLMEGITCASVPVSISGDGIPEYRICDDASCSTVKTDWTTATNGISSGEYIQLRLTTSASSDVTHTANIEMGSVTEAWNVTTVGPKVIFVTSSTHDGDIGGLSAADSICQNLANSAGLSGTFKAWLSDNTTSVSDRLNQSSQQYLRVDGVRVADNWTDLTDGDLDNPVQINENGVSVNDDVWTATTANGSGSSADCGDWQDNGNFTYGIYGISGNSTSWWTNVNQKGCNSTERLYCLEQ